MRTARSQEADLDVERRGARRATQSLAQVLDVFARYQDRHMTGEPSSEEELRRLEKALGQRLPGSFRTFLARFGGGLFFHGHEIFGPRRVMIHDIELVPDLLTIRGRLAGERPGGLPATLIPFHRARGVVHYVDVSAAGGGEQVVTFAGTPPFPDVASFLETVVLPRREPPVE